MSSVIQPNYGTRAYSTPTKTREARQAGTQGSSFLDMAAQASQSRTDTLTTGMSGLMGMAGLPTSLMMDLLVRAAKSPTPRAALTMKKAGGICVWPATPSL